MQRITIKHLNALCDELNEITKSPKTQSSRVDGRYFGHVGNFHISQAYGGYCLQRITTTGGGTTSPLNTGHIPARELFGLMTAYKRGLNAD